MNWNYFGINRSYLSTHVPAEITHPYQVADVLNTAYTLNTNGLLAARSQRFTEYYAIGSRVTSYSYDRLGQLKQADVNEYYDSDAAPCGTTDPNVGRCLPSSSGGIPYWVETRTYNWDAAGNPSGSTYVVDTGNRLTRSGIFYVEYDNDGNVTRKYRTDWPFDQRLYWNALGQLDSVRTNGVTVRYGYNGLGQRIRAGTKQFLYDGADLLMELNASGLPDRSYTYYPGVDNPHSVRLANGATYYYSTDFPGNVLALVNKNRQIVAQYTYDDFGHSNAVVDSIGGQPLRFAAREMDDATGLYYVRARWYDPDLGRFVSEDPIGLEGGINPYAYVGNNPVNGTDPSGLCVKRNGASDDEKRKVKRGEATWCPAEVALAPLTVIAIGPNPFDEPRVPLPIGGQGGSHSGGDETQVSMLIGTLKNEELVGEKCIQTRIGLRQTLNQRVERRGRTGLVRDVMWNIWAPLVYRKHFFGFVGPVQRVQYEFGKVEILTGFGAGHTLPATGSVDCTTGVLTVTAIIPG